jgi:glycerol-3-phosphate acyltransferase PlsY
MSGVLVLLAAYLIGGVPFGYILVKLKSGRDVRALGSGNIGATNVLRTTGRALGVLTLVLDIAKGAFAVWLADVLMHGSRPWMSAAALAVMFGHAFPIYLKFRGGKAVASFVGAFLYLTPLPLLATLVLFVVTVAYTRYISLGSIVGATLFPFAVWLVSTPPATIWEITAGLVAGVFIVWRHRANIHRIREGNEHVFSFGGRR